MTANRRAWHKHRSRGGWFGRAWDLGQLLRPASVTSGELLVVGTEEFDPWHVTAHLDDEARFSGVATLRPRLLRWHPSQTDPLHLRHSLDELRTAGRRHAVLVIAPGEMGEQGLERLSDARRQGATLLAVTAGNSEIEGLAHDAVAVPGAAGGDPLSDDFGLATHVVTVSAGTVSRHWRG